MKFICDEGRNMTKKYNTVRIRIYLVVFYRLPQWMCDLFTSDFFRWYVRFFIRESTSGFAFVL